MEKEVSMKFKAKFIGGKYNGMTVDYETLLTMSNGNFTRDYSEARSKGYLVQRPELDNQPLVSGYLDPLWDGLRYNGKYPIECTEEEKSTIEPVAILRYETQEVYNQMNSQKED